MKKILTNIYLLLKQGIILLWNLFMEIRSIFLEKFNATPVLKVWKWFIYVVGGIFLYVQIVDYNFLWLAGKSPDLEQLENPKLDTPSEAWTADGVLFGKYFKENRSPVDYHQIPPIVIKSLVATEDIRFYEHCGVDMQATFSIFWYLIKGDNRGGSTISQQLAKNLFKTRRGASKGLLGWIPGVKTIIAKTKEWITAVKLERTYSKSEIITLYLNTVDFGSNSFGIKAAAKTFFNTPVEKLNTQQVAMLIGLLKAPTLYSPRIHPKNAVKRRNTVLNQMAKYNVITKVNSDSLKKLNIVLDYTVEHPNDGMANYFRGVVNNMLNKWCKENGYDLYSDGLKIYTTIDSRVQKWAEQAVDEHMKTLQGTFDRHWKGETPWRDEKGNIIANFIEDYLPRTPIYRQLKKEHGENIALITRELNRPKKMTIFSWKGDIDTVLSSIDSIKYYKRFLHAGFMTMDPFSGHIKAWVGGIDYKYFKYDHVKQSMRQPGSTFKPFIYCAAIDSFGYSPCDQIVDTKKVYHYKEVSKKTGKDTIIEWSPRNSDWKVSGQSMSLRRAMAKSINTISAQLIRIIGGKDSLVGGARTVIAYARKMGIKSPLEEIPSVGLGSCDVNLFEMVGAYGTYLNRGLYTEPIFITRIEDRNGNIIKEFIPERRQAISQESAYLMVHMLKGGLEEAGGTSQGLFQFDLFRGNEFGGKTGTSSNNSDGWFMGMTKDWISGAWVGADDRSIHFRTGVLGEGARTALPIYGKFMEKIYTDKSIGITMGRFPQPKIKISKQYQCTYRPPKNDTTMVNLEDSTLLNSEETFAPVEEEIITP
jgi:penicillin-binding protein 1A